MSGKRAEGSLAFGWKTKRRRVAQTALADELAANIEEEEEREKSALEEWMRRQAASSVLQLEDAAGLSARRKDEGCILAAAGRFREAIARFQSALELTPGSAVLHELQAQCYMEAGDTYAAIQAAECAVRCDAQWAPGHQTLGRAQMNFGEVEMAIASFETAVQLDPEGMAEVRDDDLPGARQLLARKHAMVAQADAQYLAGPLAHDRTQLPPPGLSQAVRHVFGNSICLSALPPSDLMRPDGS
jgi:tetratricopeptide (TPR) repeat protein|eukprot:Tamp_20460.p2 GENE.Tamp_20460~~Tamp_20460.p2  ORF type:complete len:244 (+),score=78.80 Tamp_20460:230-961(+)